MGSGALLLGKVLKGVLVIVEKSPSVEAVRSMRLKKLRVNRGVGDVVVVRAQVFGAELWV